uniref:Apple domain-containing protein n=1 Tax=Magallana gigas TaxID=29159 RepID=A0A8W8IYQ0_MAGGI
MGKKMCVRECQSYPGRCKSVNYNRIHLSCDLNTDSATDKPEAILDREGSTYIEILTSGQRKGKYSVNWILQLERCYLKVPKHQDSDCHKEAVERKLKLPTETKDIGEVLSAADSEEKTPNRQQMLTILRNIRFRARQGLPIRGHDDNQSNFIQLG